MFTGTHLYTWVERHTVRVKCFAQEQNTVSLARDKRVNHEASHLPRTGGLDGKILYPNLQHTVACPLTGEN